MTSIYEKTRLALSVASVMALVACGGTDNSTTQSLEPTLETPSQSHTESVAQIRVGVRFPEAEANAAWLGDTTTVNIQFYATDDIDDWVSASAVVKSYETCQLDSYPDSASLSPDCSTLADTMLKGNPEAELSLTRDSSTGYLDVDPGSYRVEARFVRSDNSLNETSVSYVELDAGAHTLSLKGLAASWTLASPITLQLLGSSDLEADWDPTTAGNQSPVEALGLTGGLLGIHLPSAQTYDNQVNTDQLDLMGTEFAVQAGKLDASTVSGDDLSMLFQPVLRMSVAGGEDLSGPLFRSDVTAYDSTVDATAVTTNQSYAVVSKPALLRQQYGDSGNQTLLDLGGRYVSFDRVNLDSSTLALVNTTRNRAELQWGIASTDVESPYELLEFSEENSEYWDQTSSQWVTPTDDLVIATIAKSATLTDSWLDVFIALQGSGNTVSGGNEIGGYLIEHLYTYTSTSQAADGDDAQIPTPYLDASLNAIAVQEGLVAAAAEASCQSYSSHKRAGYSTQYLWDADNQQWIAGSYNYLISGDANIMREIDQEIAAAESNRDLSDPGSDNYNAWQGYIDSIESTFRQEVLLKADLNGDGEASLFETGVYITSGSDTPDCVLTRNDGRLGMDCERIDVETSERTTVTEQNGNICVHPFTLTASQLDTSLFPVNP